MIDIDVKYIKDTDILRKNIKVFPKRYRFIPGMLNNNKRIYEPTEIKNASVANIIYCMNYGNVVELLSDGTEVPIDTQNIRDNNEQEHKEAITTPEVGEALVDCIFVA